MMVFKWQFESDTKVNPCVTVELDDEATLEDVLEAFEGFIQACGYHLGGRLDIIPVDEDQ